MHKMSSTNIYFVLGLPTSAPHSHVHAPRYLPVRHHHVKLRLGWHAVHPVPRRQPGDGRYIVLLAAAAVDLLRSGSLSSRSLDPPSLLVHPAVDAPEPGRAVLAGFRID